MARQTIAASGIRAGDTILKTGSTDHENKRLKVTEVKRGTLGKQVVAIIGTSRGGDEKMLFRGLMPNVRVTISR